MKRLSWLLIASLVVACDGGPGPVAPQSPNASLGVAASRGPLVGPDDWIVVFRDDVVDPPGLARQLIATHGGSLRFTYQYALKGFAATLPTQALEGIRNNPNVAYVEADGVVTEDPSIMAASVQSDATWGLDRIDQPGLPLDNRYTFDFDGTGVTVYIIDSGIRITHDDFGVRASKGLDLIGDALEGEPICSGHGTHVAGTVGGSTWGVAKAVELVSVRVLDCGGSGWYSDVIAGVDWVTGVHDETDLAVANMSLGGGAYAPLDDAIAASVADGVTYAVSAGNSNANACNQSPAREETALTVGSTTSSDTRSSFSNYGTCVDIFAPGSSITSAYNTSNTATAVLSGTSMSSPHVAGVAALILDENPGFTPAQVASEIDIRATAGVLSNVGTGSPNLLLYSLFGTLPDPVDGALTSVPLPDVGGKKRKNGSVTVGVGLGLDGLGSPAEGVTVHGLWYKNGHATVVADQTAQTDLKGEASFSVGGVRNAESLEFCVTQLSGNITDGSPYVNGEVCGPYGDTGTDPAATPVIQGAVISQKGKGPYKTDVTWTKGGAEIDVYHNGMRVATVANTGSYTHNLGKGALGSQNAYKVCNAGTANCSENIGATGP
ncbi:MAG: S8 family serine peptidase [Gemmatimonadota bacterium]